MQGKAASTAHVPLQMRYVRPLFADSNRIVGLGWRHEVHLPDGASRHLSRPSKAGGWDEPNQQRQLASPQGAGPLPGGQRIGQTGDLATA